MPENEPPRAGVAAFDFDGTITQRDTLMGFLSHVAGPAAVAGALARHSKLLVRGRTDGAARDRAKELVVGRVLRGRSRDELHEAGRHYAASLPPRFRPETLEHLEQHRRNGHRTVIVSASLVYYLEPAAKALGIDGVIGVQMAFDEVSLCTGRLEGANVRGAEKERRLRQWLGADGADPQRLELWAYGNSSGDDDLLAMADHPVWIGRRSSMNDDE